MKRLWITFRKFLVDKYDLKVRSELYFVVREVKAILFVAKI